MNIVLTVLGWLSVVFFLMLTVAMIGLGSVVGGVVMLALSVVAIPPIFKRAFAPLEARWKALMEAEKGEGAGATSRPFAMLSMCWIVAFIVVVAVVPKTKGGDSNSSVSSSEEAGAEVVSLLDEIEVAREYSIVSASAVGGDMDSRVYSIVPAEPITTPSGYLTLGTQAAKDAIAATKVKSITVFVYPDERLIKSNFNTALVTYNEVVDEGIPETSAESPWSMLAFSKMPDEVSVEDAVKLLAVENALDMPAKERSAFYDKMEALRADNPPWHSAESDIELSAEQIGRIEPTESGVASVKAMEEAVCLGNATCFADKFRVDAMTRCQTAIENQARYKFEWMDGWLLWTARAFDDIRADTGKKLIYLMGNRIKFQNGFGAFQRMQYVCVFNAASMKVEKVAVSGV